MSGRIPQDFIDDLVQRADIVEVVGSRVPLTKAGREYKARCPFHTEKSPSFWVSPQKGFYHCFGCGAHGTALGFLMEFERLDFPAAVEELARSLGLEVPRSDTERASVEPLYAALEAAAKLFRQALRDHDAAVEYLKGRGLDGDTAREFGIGYAPAGWDTLLRELGAGDSERQRLLAAGLIVARDGGGFYDRFRDRIMFPIRDSRGRAIAFGGRIIANGEPKYLNSPETPVFHKGRELYGLYEARRAERSPQRLLVVEGYMDVVMLAAHGIRNVVGTLGTSTTPEHLRKLFGIVPEVVFCFDGDRAGRDAAWRALQVALPTLRDGRQVRFLLLPQGEDPDTLVRKEGAARFAARISQSLPVSQFMLDTLAQGVDVDTADGRARLAAHALPLIAQLPDAVYRELLASELADRIGIPRERLGDVAAPPTTAQASDAGKPEPPLGPRSPRRNAPSPARGSFVRQGIGVLLHFPEVARDVEIPPEVRTSGQRGAGLLAELHELARQRPDARSAVLLEHFRGRPELPHLESLLTEELLIGPDGAARELGDCFQRIQREAIKQRLSALLAKAGREGLSAPERDELGALQRVVAGGPMPAASEPLR